MVITKESYRYTIWVQTGSSLDKKSLWISGKIRFLIHNAEVKLVTLSENVDFFRSNMVQHIKKMKKNVGGLQILLIYHLSKISRQSDFISDKVQFHSVFFFLFFMHDFIQLFVVKSFLLTMYTSVGGLEPSMTSLTTHRLCLVLVLDSDVNNSVLSLNDLRT